MKHSTERFALNVVLWLIRRYLFKKYRLVSPADLEKVVEDYLLELPKLGVQLVYQDPTKIGELNEKLNNSDLSSFNEHDPRVEDPSL